jgi:hypothetical protein
MGRLFIFEGGIIIAREKTSGIYFKVSEQDRAMIERRMEQAHFRNMSAYIRTMCMDGCVIDFQQLRAASDNIKRLSQPINSDSDIHNEIATIISQLEAVCNMTIE